MKKNEYILNTFNFVRRALVGAMFVLCVPALAAVSGNGCDNPDNIYINPELALCTTHAYNAGWIENPENSGDRQIMNDIVALKSTVMMQQMYKQYEFLEATLNRMKTQLQREILTTRLEAAGATTSSGTSGSSSSGSVGGNNGVSGAENCITAGLSDDVMECLLRNVNRIQTAINNSDIGAAKRQIQTDLNVLAMYDKLEKNTPDPRDKDGKTTVSTALANALSRCNDARNNRTEMTECVNYIRACITQNIEYLQNQNRGGYNQLMR